MLIVLVRGGSLPEHGFDIASSVHNMEYSDVVSLNMIDNDIASRGNAPQALAKIVSPAAQVRMSGYLEKCLCDRIDDFVCDINATALDSDVGPDVVNLSLDLPTEKEGH